MTKKFNHCTVCIYYASKYLKEKSFEESPEVIYSLGDSKTLNKKSRHTSYSMKGKQIWIDNRDNRQSFSLSSDIVTKNI